MGTLSLPTLVLVVVAGHSVGCKKQQAAVGTAPPTATAAAAPDTATLWRFAPATTEVGFVVADGGLATARSAITTMLEAGAKVPVGRAATDKILAWSRGLPIDALSPEALTRHGIDLHKGAGVFVGSHGFVLVLPVGEPKKFTELVRSGAVPLLSGSEECAELEGRTVCVSRSATLAELRNSGGMGDAVGQWPRQVRGHAELYVAESQLAAMPLPRASGTGLRAAMVFEPGGAELRVQVTGQPQGPAASAAPAPSKLIESVADTRPSAVMVLRLSRLWDQVRDQILPGIPDQPPLGGTNPRAVAGSLTGDLAVYALPGAPMRGFAKIGLRDEAPVRALVSLCDGLPVGMVPGVSLTRKGDHQTSKNV